MTERAVTISLGCRLNAAETEGMAALAERGGRAPVIVNTCAVTREAVRQSRQAIRRAAKEHPGREVIVTGCAAEIEPQAFEAMPEVTRRLPNQEKLHPSLWSVHEAAPGPRYLDVRAPLEVQNGCDHRCTFCIIPYGRGDARSKPIAAACEEALKLTERGAKEIVLTGVDLTSWGPDLGEGLGLGHLVEALNEALPQAVDIRLSSIDGAEIDDRLFPLMTEVERIAPYAHLSLQAGDDMILKRMKRRHSRTDAVELCARLKDARPEMAFGADLIAGFPTETEGMFENSLRLVEECGLAYVHVFPFSPREGTPAAKMPQLPREVVKERAARLREVAAAALRRHLDAQVGTEAVALIEEIKDGAPKGRLPNFTEVLLPPSAGAEAGQRVPVRLTGRDGRHLLAVPTR
ncbi:MiaB/RimO family radical SAM methylthiotransferase [Parvularcula maris]|uniref:MiaB/RimO family radical SAM methylthiotransferase n=1 Tax=Parvularcula maris TaxID=2965077 RepID=A0A9X2L9Y4_9PROT|nr:MiaB/RimO family radical SAM methylthiotransferase [Parvularcula maris]MCQ8185772.1 MiaB/RimO family radical SAM methylthiotransferase [Parvularcula maris]